MLDTAIPRPAGARSYTARRRVRLSDMDAGGRLRLDAVARFLQDAAIDDVEETGWGAPEHLWVVRRIQIDVASPLLDDRSYPKQVKVTDPELAAVNLEGHAFHPEWNYTIKPRVVC